MNRKSVKKWDNILKLVQENSINVRRNSDVMSVDMHDHLFLELSYVTRGKILHTLDSKDYELSVGDYILVDYGSLHSYQSIYDGGFDNIDVLFLPSLLDPSLEDGVAMRELFSHYLLHFNTLFLSDNPTHYVFHDTDGTILKLINKIEKESLEKKAGYEQMIRCYLVEILLCTLRVLDDTSSGSKKQSIGAYISDYIAKHYNEELTLSFFAKKLNYSLPYVSKSFKQDCGFSFVEYLQNYRIKEACRLLHTSKAPIVDIAEAVGYRDVKFFTEIFKRSVGIAPSKFRKLNRV